MAFRPGENHWLRGAVYSTIQKSAAKITRIREINGVVEEVKKCEYIENVSLTSISLGNGKGAV